MSAHFLYPQTFMVWMCISGIMALKVFVILTVTWSGGVLHAPSKQSNGLEEYDKLASQTKDKAIWQALDQYGADVSIEVGPKQGIAACFKCCRAHVICVANCV